MVRATSHAHSGRRNRSPPREKTERREHRSILCTGRKPKEINGQRGKHVKARNANRTEYDRPAAFPDCGFEGGLQKIKKNYEKRGRIIAYAWVAITTVSRASRSTSFFTATSAEKLECGTVDDGKNSGRMKCVSRALAQPGLLIGTNERLVG